MSLLILVIDDEPDAGPVLDVKHSLVNVREV
jgi:hypothetical protein